MKTIKILLLSFLGMILMAATCEPEPIEEDCKCEIIGTKQISVDGIEWFYSGIDERTGMIFPCDYDENYTTSPINENGTYYRIYWQCKN